MLDDLKGQRQAPCGKKRGTFPVKATHAKTPKMYPDNRQEVASAIDNGSGPFCNHSRPIPHAAIAEATRKTQASDRAHHETLFVELGLFIQTPPRGLSRAEKRRRLNELSGRSPACPLC